MLSSCAQYSQLTKEWVSRVFLGAQVNAHSTPIHIPLSRVPQHATQLSENSSFSVPGFLKSLMQTTAQLSSDFPPTSILEVGLPPRILEQPFLRQALTQPGAGGFHVRV